MNIPWQKSRNVAESAVSLYKYYTRQFIMYVTLKYKRLYEKESPKLEFKSRDAVKCHKIAAYVIYIVIISWQLTRLSTPCICEAFVKS